MADGLFDRLLHASGFVGDSIPGYTTENLTEGAGERRQWPLDLGADVGAGIFNVLHAAWEAAASTIRGALVDVFWRTAQNLRDGAGEWWEWPLDLGADLLTLPLQIGGNLLKEVADIPYNVLSTVISAMGPENEAAWTEHVRWGVPTVDGPPSLFVADANGEDVSAADVVQGLLGDCGTMATIAAIAYRHPELIRDAIRDNGDGTYTVTFWEAGEFPWEPAWQPHEVTVDATLPLNDFGWPLYARTPNGELWPAILEKAWAMYSEGYQRMNGGLEFGILEGLTGRPARYSNGLLDGLLQLLPGPSPRAPSLAEIAAWDAREQPITAAFVGPVQSISGPPLFAKHVFYVSDVDEAAGTVTLRNPWGWSYGETVVSYEAFAETVSFVSTADVGP